MFQWLYRETTQIDIHLATTVTRTTATTWLNQ